MLRIWGVVATVALLLGTLSGIALGVKPDGPPPPGGVGDLQNQVDALAARVETLESELAAETAARMAADDALQIALAAETAARQAGDAAEQAARTAADAAEEAARIAGDNSWLAWADDIGTDISYLISAVGNLQLDVNALEALLDGVTRSGDTQLRFPGDVIAAGEVEATSGSMYANNIWEVTPGNGVRVDGVLLIDDDVYAEYVTAEDVEALHDVIANTGTVRARNVRAANELEVVVDVFVGGDVNASGNVCADWFPGSGVCLLPS